MIEFEKVFYINLDKRPDRKEKIEKELSKSKILKNIERFTAIDGTRLHPKNIEILITGLCYCLQRLLSS